MSEPLAEIFYGYDLGDLTDENGVWAGPEWMSNPVFDWHDLWKLKIAESAGWSDAGVSREENADAWLTSRREQAAAIRSCGCNLELYGVNGVERFRVAVRQSICTVSVDDVLPLADIPEPAPEWGALLDKFMQVLDLPTLSGLGWYVCVSYWGDE